MTLPEVAERLRAIASQTGIPELWDLAAEIRRRRGKRGPITSVRITPELRDEIRAYARRHPDLSQAQVASHFGVNPGRVSEALKGFRT